MNADGSGDTRLTDTPIQTLVNEQIAGQQALQWNNASPAWSPDGSQIAFVSDRTGQWQFWLMNADGSNQHQLFPNGMPTGLTLQYSAQGERMLAWGKSRGVICKPRSSPLNMGRIRLVGESLCSQRTSRS